MRLSLVKSEFDSLHSLQDIAYLSPIIKEIESESKERDDLEAMVVSKKK